jgi:DNA invertase Pin-like site-specific DNA recombinase
VSELDAAGVALISEQQGIDATGPFGGAMMQMATVFAELEQSMIRSRVMAGTDRVRAEGKITSKYVHTADAVLLTAVDAVANKSMKLMHGAM